MNDKRKSGLGNFIVCVIGLLVTILFLLNGCRSSKPQASSTQETTLKQVLNDSVNRIEKTNARLLTIPTSKVNLNLNISNLSQLPIGAKFQNKQDQATVTVEKVGNDEYKITATCDSLSTIITEKETEIFHLRTQVEELRGEKSEVTIVKVNELTKYQTICVWIVSIILGLVGVAGVIGLIILFVKWKS